MFPKTYWAPRCFLLVALSFFNPRAFISKHAFLLDPYIFSLLIYAVIQFA